MVKGLEYPFLQRKYSNGNKHMRKCTTELVVRETQNETTVRYPCTPTGMAITEKSGK